jgi:hypothetical protein
LHKLGALLATLAKVSSFSPIIIQCAGKAEGVLSRDARPDIVRSISAQIGLLTFASDLRHGFSFIS